MQGLLHKDKDLLQIQDHSGRTALDLAVWNRHAEVMSVLQAADKTLRFLQIPDKKSRTALPEVAVNVHEEGIEEFFDCDNREVYISLHDNGGFNAIDCLSQKKHSTVAQDLAQVQAQYQQVRFQAQQSVVSYCDGLKSVNDDIACFRSDTSSNLKNDCSQNSGESIASASESLEQLSWWQKIWIFSIAVVDSRMCFCASIAERICSCFESNRGPRTLHSPSSVPATASLAFQSLNDSGAPLRREESGIDRRKRKNL